MLTETQSRIKESLVQLLEIPSPSFHERRIIDRLICLAERYGYEAREDNSRGKTGCEAGNLLVTDPGWNPEARSCVFAAHVDTVPTGPEIRILDQGRVLASATEYPIGLDDKAGAAVLLELMRRLRGRPWAAQTAFLFLVCEEEGCRGSRFLEMDGLENHCFFVVDSGGPAGLVNNRGFGQSGILLTVKGEDIHAGSAGGTSAVEDLAHIILALPPGRRGEAVTWNISDLICNGAVNTFPRSVAVKGELHWETDEDRKGFLHVARETLERIVPGRWRLEEEEQCVPFCTPEGSALVEMCRTAADLCGLPFRLGTTRACSDAHVLASRGGTAVKLACGMEAVHTGRERIDLEQLESCVRMSEALAMAASGKY